MASSIEDNFVKAKTVQLAAQAFVFLHLIIINMLLIGVCGGAEDLEESERAQDVSGIVCHAPRLRILQQRVVIYREFAYLVSKVPFQLKER